MITHNLYHHPILSLFIMIFMGMFGNQTLKNQDLVISFIEARNNYDVEKVNTLIQDHYYELFMDGSKEIESKEQLMDIILWGKELDSHISLLDISVNKDTIITIEENTNFLDVALQRKPRKFKITYSFLNGKIKNQSIDTLGGHQSIIKFNALKYQEFIAYCQQHNLTYHGKSLNKEFGVQLRKVLEQYKSVNQNKP